jgi:hypothetical protein
MHPIKSTYRQPFSTALKAGRGDASWASAGEICDGGVRRAGTSTTDKHSPIRSLALHRSSSDHSFGGLITEILLDRGNGSAELPSLRLQSRHILTATLDFEGLCSRVAEPRQQSPGRSSDSSSAGS